MPDKAKQAPDTLSFDEAVGSPDTSANQTEPTQTINTPGEMLSATGKMAGDVLTGIGKGALHTISGTDEWAREHLPAFLTNSNLGFGKPADLEHVKQMATPTNTAQKIGYGGEQVGEFLLPGDAEKAAVGKMAEYAPKALPLIRTGVGALSAGAVNKAQGGSFTQGATTGGIAGGIGEGLRAAAPSVMKNALRVGSEGLEYGRDTGKSVLDHTTGVRPGSIARQAQDKVSDWDSEMNDILKDAPKANMTPIRSAHDERIALANYRNSPTEQKLLERLKQPLHMEFENGKAAMRDVIEDVQKPSGVLDASGKPLMTTEPKVTGQEPVPIPNRVPAVRLRAIKQGVGSEVGNFSPQNQALGAQYKKQLYGDIDSEMNRVAPGSAELDAKMSSLIPAIRAGQKVEAAAPIPQRVFHRIAAHSGAVAGGIAGSYSGYQHGGMPGAVMGGAAGLIVPEVMVSPETQATLARTMYSPATGRIMRSVTTPLTRETLDWIKKQNTGKGGSTE